MVVPLLHHGKQTSVGSGLQNVGEPVLFFWGENSGAFIHKCLKLYCTVDDITLTQDTASLCVG